ncbi:MAG: glucose-1-phosphate adenylyltransferase subunit GlgD [Bacilli bacterium]|nr:glucose-1-phosphate adenylyltransferase subunit GlgD [Bacilli bacterium]
MKKIIGFCNLHNSPQLGQLTASRPMASTSFLGRYAFIDFCLSNFSNSGIDQIGILVRDHARSLNKHLGSSFPWNINTKLGTQVIMYNELSHLNNRYNTDLNNIRENDWFIIKSNAEYVVIAPVHVLATINYAKVVECHIESGADVTVVYAANQNTKDEFLGCDLLTIDKDNRVSKFTSNRGVDSVSNVSMESYVMTKDKLKEILKDSLEVSSIFTLRDYLSYSVNKLNIRGYKYEGYVRCFDSLQKYLKYSLELLNYNVRSTLFSNDWPIYTVTHDTPPSKYGKGAKVTNSFIANGAVINGEVENSIISRYVHVSDGAKIKNSIILTDAIVTNDACIENCIIDKYTRIVTVDDLKGTENEPLYIKQGDII